MRLINNCLVVNYVLGQSVNHVPLDRDPSPTVIEYNLSVREAFRLPFVVFNSVSSCKEKRTKSLQFFVLSVGNELSKLSLRAQP